jgi:hypothetical protein
MRQRRHRALPSRSRTRHFVDWTGRYTRDKNVCPRPPVQPLLVGWGQHFVAHLRGRCMASKYSYCQGAGAERPILYRQTVLNALRDVDTRS